MSDTPDYDVFELLLCGLFVAAAVSYLIYAGYAYVNDEPFDAMEGAGLSLLLFGGSVDPKKYVIDCLNFHGTEPGAKLLYRADIFQRDAAGKR